jgi:hypothetical protein
MGRRECCAGNDCECRVAKFPCLVQLRPIADVVRSERLELDQLNLSR